MIGRVIWAKNVDQNTKKWKIPPKSSKNVCFWITFKFWGLAEQSQQKMLTEMQKNEKGPLSHRKIKCLFLDYVQLLMIGQAIWAKNVVRNAKKEKGPQSHRKIKCLFLDYVQLLMIGWVIWAKNVDQNTKKWKGPLSHGKIKCLFLDYVQILRIGRAIPAKNIDRNAKKWKTPPKSLKNKMFVFGLCSTFNDRPSNLSKKCWPKCKKMKKAP